MLGDFFGHARLLGDVQRAQHACREAGRRRVLSLRRTGLRLLGGLVRGASSAASEKADDARSAGEFCAFGGQLEAVNAVVLPKCAAGLVCIDAS